MFSIRVEGSLQIASAGTVCQDTQDYECIEEVWMHLCSALSSIDGIKFVIEGFGVKWPVDVETDLSTVIPQVFDGLELLKSDRGFSIELFEQGIEKELNFIISCDDVEITCSNMVGGEKLAKLEVIEKKNLLKMLHDFNEQLLIAGRLMIKDFDSLLDTLD